jgi:hypothetical protein
MRGLRQRHHSFRHVYDPGLVVREPWHPACTLPDVPIQAFVEVIRILKKCEAALEQEQEHLENVRAWLSEVTLKEVTGDNPSSADDATGTNDEADTDEKEDDGRAGRKSRKGATRPRASQSKRRKK